VRVLHLNTHDANGGAARAAYRLHLGLRDAGVDSQFLVQSKTSDDPCVLGPTTAPQKVWAKIRPRLDAMPVRFYPNRENVIYSSAIVPDRIVKKVNALAPNVVHLHWVLGGFLRIETLKKIKRPIIWTLHDMWPFTGGCHYDEDCGRYRDSCGQCPALGSSRSHDISRWIWTRKAHSWSGVEMIVVAPSRWLAACAKESALFRRHRIEIIPNGLDLDRFKPIDKVLARALWSMPPHKRLILFGAMNAGTDERKGLDALRRALTKIAAMTIGKECIVCVFGASRPTQSPDLGLETRYLGVLHDDVSLASLYSAVDVFVAPARQDNLPNTVMEALACGTPCVAFDIGGMPDMIEHQRTGYLAKPFDSNDLANGIEWVLQSRGPSGSPAWQTREKVEAEFSIQRMTNRYMSLYEEVQ